MNKQVSIERSKPIRWVDLICEVGKPCKIAPVMQEQPNPTQNTNPCVQDLVIKDIENRKEVGKQRYGTLLQPFNGRSALWDAYFEALDLTQYLRQLIYEEEHAKTSVS